MKESRLQKIFSIIEKYEMIKSGMRVVTGVSGGADSVCLLYVLGKYREHVPFELMAVHVEHGIRGAESLSDAAFTQELCKMLDVPCRVVSVPVQEIAARRGLSVEEAGRAERYRIFEEVRREWSGDRIAVAHNQNDQAETVLWNLARGSGIKGLGGIRPVRDRIIRPLLFTERKEIEQILLEAGLSWRTDRTNLTEDYTRNKIRLSILPQMEQGLNEQAVKHIAEAAGRMQQMQEFLDRAVEEAAQKCLRYTENEHVKILLESYFVQDALVQTELWRRALTLLGGGNGLRDIGSVHLEMLEGLAQMDCGRECHLPGGVRAVRENGIVRLCKQAPENIRKAKYKYSADASRQSELQNSADTSQQSELQNSADASRQLEHIYSTDMSRKPEQKNSADMSQQPERKNIVDTNRQPEHKTEIPLPPHGTFEFHGWRGKTELLAWNSQIQTQILEEKKYTKWLNYDIIKSNVQLRTRRSGDYLVIDAGGGRKKLKDYFIDRKIPREKRDQILLLADGSHILWIVGYRISEAAKVTDQTEQILKIQMEEPV